MQEFDSPGLRRIDQELKEAVCNAIVNLSVARVTGSAPEGRTLYGPSPRRSIVSGQLLPRFDQSGQDDESTDIRIAALGIDFQVAADADAEASVAPRFSVYVRVLPNWDEIRNPDLELEVDFRLNAAVQTNIDTRMRQLREERFLVEGVASPQWNSLTPTQKGVVRATRARIQEEVRIVAYREQGIILERGEDQFAPVEPVENEAQVQQPAASNDGVAAPPVDAEDDGAEVRLRAGLLLQRGQSIPPALLEPADPPSKWRRIDLELPTFRWRLNSDSVQEALRYSEELRRAALEQVSAWFASPEGMQEAWRNLRVQPQDILSIEVWNNYRARAAQIPVPLTDLVPKLDGVSLQIDRVPDFSDQRHASIRAVLDNRTPELTRRETRTRTDTLFCVSLTLTIPTTVHHSLQLDRVEPSYRFRHFLSYPAIGLNCGVDCDASPKLTVLRTTWAPRFVQPRILPREIPMPVTFAALGNEATDIDSLLVLPREYANWITTEDERLRGAVREGLPAEEADRESLRPSMSISFTKYVNAGMPEAEAVADIAAMLDGAQPPEEQERRAKMRQHGQRQRLEWQLSCGRFADANVPSWGRDKILDEARRRRDVMGAAIAACEQRKDSDEILASLAQHLAGRDHIGALESALHRAGLSVEAGNVVPFIPQQRRS